MPSVYCLDQRLIVPDLAQSERDERSMISRRALAKRKAVRDWLSLQAEGQPLKEVAEGLKASLRPVPSAALIAWNPLWVAPSR
jgi:hypothetical protein